MEDTDPSPAPAPPPLMDLGSIKALSVLGRGAKGVVFLVRTPTDDTLALKAISRSSIELRRSATDSSGSPYRRIWFERDVLLSLHHPLLPSLRGVVKTDRIVAFAIDQCPGGNLSSLRRRQTEQSFSDDIIRFYAAELVLALEHLHRSGIVYRDLKPENILIQETGHIMLVDFDLSTRLPFKSPTPIRNPRNEKESPVTIKKKKSNYLRCLSCTTGVSPEEEEPPPPPSDPSPPPQSVSEKSNSFVGTEEYVAPEVIKGSGHDYAVDWWGLGVVLYEMLYGRTPFRGENRKETFYRVLVKEPELAGERRPLRDLIGRLLEKDPGKRISCDEIKEHEFFRGVDWESVLLVARPPFIPAAAAADDGEMEAIDVEKVVQDVFGEERLADSRNSVKETSGKEAKKTSDFSEF